MDFDSTARQCWTLVNEGKDYEEVLKKASTQDLTEKEQKELRSLINDLIVQFHLREQVKMKYKTQMMLGGVTLFVGIFILLFTYFRKESSFAIGLAVSLIGIYVFKKGYDQHQHPLDYQDIAPKKESKFHRY